MKVKFIIDSPLFKRTISLKADWNFPCMPRIGEVISPLIIMLNEELNYMNISELLTDEATEDLHKYLTCNEKVEEEFKGWIYDVICEANIIESIHYIPNQENYREIIAEIYLSDLRN